MEEQTMLKKLLEYVDDVEKRADTLGDKDLIIKIAKVEAFLLVAIETFDWLKGETDKKNT